MTNALLEKARAILTHPKQGPTPVASREAAEYTKVSMTKPTTQASTPLEKAPRHVAPATKSIEIQPTAPNAKAIYWETGDGRIVGPAVPEFLGRDGNTFWINTTFEGQIRWINADRLRSRKAFEDQAVVRELELIRF